MSTVSYPTHRLIADSTPVAKNVLAYSAEVGVNLAIVSGIRQCPVIYPFVQYEYYNPQQRVEQPRTPRQAS